MAKVKLRVDQMIFPDNREIPRNLSEWVSSEDVDVTYSKGEDRVRKYAVIKSQKILYF